MRRFPTIATMVVLLYVLLARYRPMATDGEAIHVVCKVKCPSLSGDP